MFVTVNELFLTVKWSKPIPNCNHEEADTKIVVHVLHVLQQGWKTVQVCTVHTDVVVVIVYLIECYSPSLFLNSVSLHGKGKNYRLYSVNDICNSLSVRMSQVLPMFHALSGCDISSFREKGKKSFWQACLVFAEATETHAYLVSHP